MQLKLVHFAFHLLLLLLLFTSVAFVSLSSDPLFAVVTRRLRAPSTSGAVNFAGEQCFEPNYNGFVDMVLVSCAFLFRPCRTFAIYARHEFGVFRIVISLSYCARRARGVRILACVYSMRTINARAQCALCIHRLIVCVAIQEQQFCRIVCIIYIWSEFYRKRRGDGRKDDEAMGKSILRISCVLAVHGDIWLGID